MALAATSLLCPQCCLPGASSSWEIGHSLAFCPHSASSWVLPCSSSGVLSLIHVCSSWVVSGSAQRSSDVSLGERDGTGTGGDFVEGVCGCGPGEDLISQGSDW